MPFLTDGSAAASVPTLGLAGGELETRTSRQADNSRRDRQLGRPQSLGGVRLVPASAPERPFRARGPPLVAAQRQLHGSSLAARSAESSRARDPATPTERAPLAGRTGT